MRKKPRDPSEQPERPVTLLVKEGFTELPIDVQEAVQKFFPNLDELLVRIENLGYKPGKDMLHRVMETLDRRLSAVREYFNKPDMFSSAEAFSQLPPNIQGIIQKHRNNIVELEGALRPILLAITPAKKRDHIRSLIFKALEMGER